MTASHFRTTLSQESALQVSQSLQPILTDLLDLSLQLKHAHWNVRGALFMPLHEQLDAIHASVSEAADSIAERQVTLGHPADGLSQSISSNTRLNPIRVNFLPCQEVIEDMSNRISRVIAFLRVAIEALGEIDPVSQDLLIGITGELEKHLWMLQVQQL